MGCFLGCLGGSNKKKKKNSPRRPYTRLLVKDIIRGSCEHLGSTLPLINESSEDAGCLETETEYRDKPKNELRSKIRKKVTFNLNVQVFEPVSTDYHILENEEENESGIVEVKSEESGGLFSAPSAGLNYRYRNCLDSYDEDDEIAFDDCELDDEMEDEIGEEYHDVEDYFDSLSSSLDDFSERFGSMSLEPKKLPVEQLDIAEDNKALPNENARDRSRYVHSVLNPIENLSQWKAVKGGRGIAGVPKHPRKENCAVEKAADLEFNPRSTCNANQSKIPNKVVAVDASLSNWLA